MSQSLYLLGCGVGDSSLCIHTYIYHFVGPQFCRTTVGHETCQRKALHTDKTRQYNTKQQISKLQSPIQYCAKHNNKVIQYTLQQERFIELIVSANLQTVFDRVKHVI